MTTVYIPGDETRFANYRRAVKAAGGCAVFDGDPLRCDALLLPGGGDVAPWRYGEPNLACRGIEPARDGEELRLLEQFAACRKPVLGICRGAQVLNVFFGGTLMQDITGHSAAGGIDRRHAVRTAASPLREICGEACIVNSSHHQAADRLGRGLTALQWTPDGTVEALKHDTLPVLGLQWHPERMEDPLRLRMFRWFLAWKP